MTKDKTGKPLQQNERQSSDKKNQDFNKQNSGDGIKNLNKDEKHPVKKDEEDNYDPNHRPAKNQVDPKRKDSDMNDDDDSMENPNEKERIKKRIDTDLNEGEMDEEEDLDADINEEEEMDENGKVIKRRKPAASDFEDDEDAKV